MTKKLSAVIAFAILMSLLVPIGTLAVAEEERWIMDVFHLYPQPSHICYTWVETDIDDGSILSATQIEHVMVYVGVSGVRYKCSNYIVGHGYCTYTR